MPSRFLAGSRDVIVYLPPNYNSLETYRFPVFYLQDGQNLFDRETAFAHREWGLDEVIERLVAAQEIRPLIAVGVYNAGTERLWEYTHTRNSQGQGGRALRYSRFLVEELKPFIDREYRTLPECEYTGLGGSSLGGLVTLYTGLRHPEVFGRLMVISASVWWGNRSILRHAGRSHRAVRTSRPAGNASIWLDMGTCEGSDPRSCLEDARALRDTLLARGWQAGHNLHYFEDEGAGHDEAAWGGRSAGALRFLFPAE